MKRILRSLIIVLAFAAVVVKAEPVKPFLHGLFTDNMILQRDVLCPIWGWTAPGTKVTVTLGEQTVSATADSDGRWMAKIGPKPAGGPHTVTIAGLKSVTLKNVLFGDVWICSGQSNMDFGIDGVNQWWNELPGGQVDGIRLYWIKPTSSFEPEATVTGSWAVASNESLLNNKKPYTTVGFSAIAWMFGRKVHKQAGVPIGMIECAQGNSSIQPWSTLASLRQEPKYGAALDAFTFYEKEVTGWAKASDPAYAQTESWRTSEFDDSSWSTIDLPQGTNKTALSGFNGIVWFRRQVEVPSAFAGQELWLNLGPVQEQDTTWFNGVFVGGQDGYRRDHAFLVPGKLVKAGANLISVRVLGNGSFIGKPEQLKLSVNNVSGESVSLAGPWKYQTSTPANKLTGRKRQYDRIWMPAGLYNGMVAPMAPFAIKGVLWYQGEGNSGQVEYERELTSMIRDWRAVFGQGDFPFYIVQLAGFGQLPNVPGNASWAVTREIQARVARTVPNSGLAVAIDRGEIHDIHPPNKRDVAERLAALALAKAYKMDVPCEGPTYKGMKIDNGRIRISFDNAAALKSLGSGPAGFAIAGADKKFVWAQTSLDGETVLVSSPEVKEPVAVRYGWGDNALCNLYNNADLPAVPFRTDTW